MKTYKIEIQCDLICMEYCSKMELDIHEDETFNDLCDTTFGMDNLTALYVNEDRENNLIKQKGKYHFNNGFFHVLWNEQAIHPLPVEVHMRVLKGNYPTYTVELEDGEEFDIKKLQLIKSQYEAAAIPFWIIADYIYYDNHKVEADPSLWDLGIDGKYHDKYKIKSLYP